MKLFKVKMGDDVQNGDCYCCLFCYRTFKGVPLTSSKNVEKTQDLFLLLIKRHLFIGSDSDSVNPINRFSADLKLSNKSLRNVISPCADCLEIIKSFCDHYEEIKVLGMKLEWRLQTLTKIVKSSEKVKFRRKLFQEKLEENGAVGMDIKDIMKRLKRFRMELVKKCTGRFRNSYPKVELRKCDAFKGKAHRAARKRQNDNSDGDVIVDVPNTKVPKLADLDEEVDRADRQYQIREPMHLESEIKLISVPETTTEAKDTVIGSPRTTTDDMNGDSDGVSISGTELATVVSCNNFNYDNGDNSISFPAPQKKTSSFTPTVTTDEVGNSYFMDLKTDTDNITNSSNDQTQTSTLLTAFESSMESNEEHSEPDVVIARSSSSNSPILFDMESVDCKSIEMAECSKSPKGVEKNPQLKDNLKINMETHVDLEHSEETDDVLSLQLPEEKDDRKLLAELAKQELIDVPDAGNQGGIGIPLELHTSLILETESESLKAFKNTETLSRPETVSVDEIAVTTEPTAVSGITPTPTRGRRVSLRQRYPCTTCSQKFSSSDKLQEHLKTCVNCEISTGEEESESEVNQLNDNDFEDFASSEEDEDEDDTNAQEDILSEQEEDYKIPANKSDDEIQCTNRVTRRPIIRKEEYDFMKTLFKCDRRKCDSFFYNEADLHNHSKLHGDFKCSSCETLMSYAPELALHELQHQKKQSKTKSKRLSCPRENCPYFTKHRSNFIRHFITCFLKLFPNVHTCPVCKLQVSTHTGSYTISKHFRTYHHDLVPDSIFRCEVPECSAYFRTKLQLSYHRSIIHNRGNGFICEECGDTFTSKPYLRLHWKKIREDGFLRCEVKGCEKRFRFKANLKVHISLEHSNTSCSTCYFCRKTFSSRSYLIFHQNQVHQKIELDLKPADNCIRKTGNENVLKCPVTNCLEKFYNRENLEAHAKLHGNFKCFFCEESKTYAPDLAVHEASCKKMVQSASSSKKKSRSGNELFSCPHCDFPGTAYELRFVQHHLQAHLNLELAVSCMCCICKWAAKVDVNFPKRIAHHYTTHHYLQGEKHNSVAVYRCDKKDCDAYFLKLDQLVSHKSLVHNEKPKYPCPDCDKVCTEQQGLQAHRMKKHKGKLQFPCTHPGCLLRFDDEKSVQEHLSKRHSKEMTKEEVCSECGKKFQGLNALVMHAKTHASQPKPKAPKIKNFICPECGKSFLGKEKLQNHILCVHLGPEGWEFSCDICNKKCMTKQKLEEHQRTHTQEKPFTCEHCGSSYAHRHNFRIHLKSKHDMILETPKRVRKDAL